MDNTIGGIISAFAILAVFYFFWNFFTNEPEIIVHDANVYEYNEFMFAGEALELGLDSGMGNYFKYSGDYDIEVEFMEADEIIQYDIKIELIDTNGEDIIIYEASFPNPDVLTFVGQFPETEFFEDDFEEARLTLTIHYYDNKNNEQSFYRTHIINIDEDFF